MTSKKKEIKKNRLLFKDKTIFIASSTFPIKRTNVSRINRIKERWKCIIEAKLATCPLKVHAKLDNWPISGNIVFYSVIPISTCTREKLTFVFPDDFTGRTD